LLFAAGLAMLGHALLETTGRKTGMRAVRSRRSTSGARFFAVAISHAEGFSGTPRNFPHLERSAEGILHDVFCQREVMNSEDARKRGNHAARFAPE
jgi:hypothetical protein